MRQIILDFGVLDLGGWSVPLRVYGYGLMLVFGFLTAIALAHHRAKRVGEDGEVLTACGILALIGGVSGARIAYVVENWRSFSDSPNLIADIFNLSSGGLIYYGGVVLATAMAWGYLRVRKLPVRRYLDILAVSIMVGLAFGRAGCLLNGCCYGDRCRADWPLAMQFPMYSKPLLKFDGRDNPYSKGTMAPSPVYDHQYGRGEIQPDPHLFGPAGNLVTPANFTPAQYRIAEASWSLPVQPAQAMGIINALLIAAVLAGFYRLRSREGQVFALMLVLYPITRFALESLRAGNRHDLLAGVLTHNQYTSIFLVLIGIGMFLTLQKLPASAGPWWAQRRATSGRRIENVKNNKSSRNKTAKK